jgi:hypothetical protein
VGPAVSHSRAGTPEPKPNRERLAPPCVPGFTSSTCSWFWPDRSSVCFYPANEWAGTLGRRAVPS